MIALVAAVALAAACSTPAPTPSPTATPLATPSPRAEALAAFRALASAGGASSGVLVRSMGLASAGGNDDVAMVVVQMRTWVASQEAWLADHPADPCYAEAVEVFRVGVDAIATSADRFDELAAGPAPIDPDAGSSAAEYLSEGVTEMGTAVQLAVDARIACD